MTKTVRAAFDGEVLRPEEPAVLERNATYIVTLEREMAASEDARGEVYPLTEIGRLATDMGAVRMGSGSMS